MFNLRCTTIKHIPAKSRPAFAKPLLSTLQDVLHSNNEIACLKLFYSQSVFYNHKWSSIDIWNTDEQIFWLIHVVVQSNMTF